MPVHVSGKDKGAIMLYALSTCQWCHKTKMLLEELGLAFDYDYVDLLSGSEQDTAMDELERWNPKGSFPTLIINNKRAIIGFKETEIRGAFAV
ncbi:MAG TPA: glutaredoxin family protein [Methanoregula sp.]|nr:glutaredoxin family protein [Methanoregula sp.]